MENHELIRSRTPVDYLKIFFRRKWLFITPAFVGLVFGIIAGLLIPPTYESSTVILVEEEKIINPLIQGLAVSTSIGDRIRTIREQILSWNSLVELAKKLNLAKDANNQGQFEALILGLRKNMYVQLSGPNLIRISYYGKNPQETQIIVKTLTDIFINENMRTQTKETDVAIGFIKEQLQVYKRKIKQSEISSMEEQLKKLLQDSTEGHPLVKELREKIAAANKELNSGEYRVTGSEKPINSPVYASLKKELDKITGEDNSSVAAGTSVTSSYGAAPQAPGDPNAAIYKLLLMDKLDNAYARDMNVNENIYNMLLQKLETAKITQRLEASKEGTRYTIIDPPRLPLKPKKPNKFMVMFIGMFLGSCSGAGLVLGRDFMDHSFLDIEDARKNLDFPVLGAISRITTQEEVSKEKEKKKILVFSALFASLLLILITLVIYFLKR